MSRTRTFVAGLATIALTFVGLSVAAGPASATAAATVVGTGGCSTATDVSPYTSLVGQVTGTGLAASALYGVGIGAAPTTNTGTNLVGTDANGSIIVSESLYLVAGSFATSSSQTWGLYLYNSGTSTFAATADASGTLSVASGNCGPTTSTSSIVVDCPTHTGTLTITGRDPERQYGGATATATGVSGTGGTQTVFADSQGAFAFAVHVTVVDGESSMAWTVAPSTGTNPPPIATGTVNWTACHTAPPPPTYALTLAPSRTIIYGAVSGISTTALFHGSPHAGAIVRFYGRAHNSGPYTLLKVLITNSHGQASVTVSPQAYRQYVWQWRNSAGGVLTTSPTMAVSVAQKVTLAIDPPSTNVPLNSSFFLIGQVSPIDVGEPVYLQGQFNGDTTWQSFPPTKIVKVKDPDTGKYLIFFGYKILANVAATVNFRAFVPARVGAGLANGYSPVVTVTSS
jgi:hypothetical protein